jgi:hypothetical protein
MGTTLDDFPVTLFGEEEVQTSLYALCQGRASVIGSFVHHPLDGVSSD